MYIEVDGVAIDAKKNAGLLFTSIQEQLALKAELVSTLSLAVIKNDTRLAAT